MNVNFHHFSVGSLRRRLGDAISPETIVQIYLEESPQLIEALTQERFKPISLESLGAAVHRIKGSLAMLCAESTTDLAEAVIRACREGHKAEAYARCDQLLSGLRSLRLELERFLEHAKAV